MLHSFTKFLTVVAAVTATAYGSPQGWGGSGGQGGDQSGSGSGSGSGGNAFSSQVTATPTYSLAGSSTSSTATSCYSGCTTATSTVEDGTACNGSPDLCDRTYDNVTHIGAHDSPFLRDDSTDNSIAGTQYFNATYALNNGLRLLQLQVHDLNGTIEACHTTCSLLDGGSLQDWLSAVKAWMDYNPNEVVTLLIVNSDSFNATEFGPVFAATNIDNYAYTPTSTTWPTLGEMIDANKRLVVFIASFTTDTTYTYLLNEWDYIFETAYEVTSLSGFNCTLDRPSTYDSASAAISAGMMPLMNHFAYTVVATYEIPDASDVETTNSPSTTTEGALGLHAQNCNSEWSMAPTFVLVDFFNKGPAITTGDNLNGITASGRSNSTSADGSTSDAGRVTRGSLAALLTAAMVAVLLG